LPSALAVALGKENFKKKIGFAECLGAMALGKEFWKKKENSLPSVALGKEIKKKLRRRRPSANGRQSFAECQLDTRQRLYRVPEIWHSAKQALPWKGSTEPLCRVLHSAKDLPSAWVPLPSAWGHSAKRVAAVVILFGTRVILIKALPNDAPVISSWHVKRNNKKVSSRTAEEHGSGEQRLCIWFKTVRARDDFLASDDYSSTFLSSMSENS